MRLKDLVYRSALRRGAGETEVGNASTQVFEVTNLLIPSGTDWSAAMHELGALPVAASKVYVFSLYLELAGAPDPDTLVLAANDDVSPIAYNDGVNISVFGVGTPIKTDEDLLRPAADATFHVGLYTAGPTTADITVVRARAAFLVI